MRNQLLLLVSLVIPASNFAQSRIIATIGVGDTPAGIAITPDGRYAYVANNNNDGIINGDSISVIDLSTNTVITTINDASFYEPYTITINPAGTLAYVTNSGGSVVSVINIATNQVVQTIGGFDGPSGLVITPDGSTAYVNNYGGPVLGSGNGRTVNVVNLTSHIITSTITVDLAPAAIAISPNGAYVYTANYVDGNPGTGTMNTIQTSNNTVVGRVTGFSGPFDMVITPDGHYAYITNFGSNNFSPVGTTVSVVNLEQNLISATIQLGTQPAGIALSSDGRLAYVTNYNTLYLGAGFTDLTPGVGTVNIIDTCTNKVLCPVIIVGASPANIAISPNGCRAYVSNYSDNTVSVINIADHMLLNSCRNR